MPQKRKRTQKTRKRVAREHRQNLRLWAEGPREDILTPHIAPYADALDRSWRDEREYLQSVCNEFHQRISWRLADHEQPELPLAAYNPDSDDSEELDDEEMKEKRTRITLLNAVSSVTKVTFIPRDRDAHLAHPTLAQVSSSPPPQAASSQTRRVQGRMGRPPR
jgi:hypothetical protein